MKFGRDYRRFKLTYQLVHKNPYGVLAYKYGFRIGVFGSIGGLGLLFSRPEAA